MGRHRPNKEVRSQLKQAIGQECLAALVQQTGLSQKSFSHDCRE